MAQLQDNNEGRRPFPQQRSKKSAAPITATSRLRNDYLRLIKDPVPYIIAEPLPSNILEWHYVVSGPKDSPYTGGYYHGKVCMNFDNFISKECFALRCMFFIHKISAIFSKFQH